MPVECSIDIFPTGRERFHELDKVVMRHAFDLHNELGKLCDEQIYQTELAMRCREAEIKCVREVELRVRHGSFEKSYYMDLLIDQGVAYELKTASILTSAHQNQLINYLLLAGIPHGKLINFRSSSVQSRFVSTELNQTNRRKFQITDTGWHRCEESQRLKVSLTSIVEDLGAFLDVQLYREALIHLLDAPGAGHLPVPILRSACIVGHQKMCLLSPEHAWHVSSIKNGLHTDEIHVRRLMSRTPLKMLHWINFNNDQITLRSLENDLVVK